jgi:glycosyltransferase involved in cell wall biosynthesis
MSQPLVSIVMPVYNAEKFLDEAIRSVLNQTFLDFELLICDDCSKDSSFQIASSFKDDRIKLFKNIENVGYLKTCNFLFGHVSGKWIGFQDADDISDPQRFENIVNFLRRYPDHVLCGTQSYYFHQHIDNVIRHKRVAREHADILNNLYELSQFCGASVIVRKDVFEQVGYYQLYFDRLGNEDYDAFFRIAQKYKVANLDQTLYFVRENPASVSRAIKNHRQLTSHDVVKFLGMQRNQFGNDSLTGYASEALREFEKKLARPFLLDESLVWRKSADLLSYNGLHKPAFVSAWRAFVTNPFKIINLKYLISLSWKASRVIVTEVESKF